MSESSKWIWREVIRLRRYAAEVAEQWKGILGSAVVISVLWIAGHFGASLLVHVVSFFPISAAPWLTRNRLIAYSILAVLSLAQYLAWRKLRVEADGKEPDIDPRLKLIEEMPTVAKDQQLAYSLVMTFEAQAEVPVSSLAVESRGPIYKAYADYFGKHSEVRLQQKHSKHIRANKILFEFPVPGIAAKDQLYVVLHSTTPVQLASVHFQ